MSPRTSIAVWRFGSYAKPPGTRWLSFETVLMTSLSVRFAAASFVGIDLDLVRRRDDAADIGERDAGNLLDLRHDHVLRDSESSESVSFFEYNASVTTTDSAGSRRLTVGGVMFVGKQLFRRLHRLVREREIGRRVR